MGEDSRGTGRATIALALAVAGLALSWVPFLGVALAVGALLVAFRARRYVARPPGEEPDARGRKRLGSSIALGSLALLLGLAFTGAYGACTPGTSDPSEQRTWEEFDRAFQPSAAPDASTP